MVYSLRASDLSEPELTIVCLSWETVHLHGEIWISHHRLRHRLFVERQGWEVPSYRGMEHDEFDTPAAQYLLWLDDVGETRGVARLLPTMRPYMLRKLWPDMVSDELPESDSIWEATRFGCDQSLSPPVRRRAVAEILCAMQEFGIMHGIERYLAVMPLRLLQCVVVKAGCQVQVLGPARLIGRFPTVAAYLTVSSDVLAELRRRAALRGAVLPNEVSIAA
jgi:N-acyl-L-homoserine lactone synthetase